MNNPGRRLLAAMVLLVMSASLQAQTQSQLNDQAGRTFLQENAGKPGITTTASGLQYEVLQEGRKDGKRPAATSRVKVNYEGRHLDGEVFDSSYKRGKPASFRLNQVIKGWTEGVQLMSEGASYRFFIPPELAYGSRGAGGSIGSNETLVFDIELLKVE